MQPFSRSGPPARAPRGGWRGLAALGAALLGMLAARPAVAGSLLVCDNTQVLRYNAATGAFVDIFIPTGTGGLAGPSSLLLGGDGNLYVLDNATNSVLRCNAATGAFLDTFVTTGSGGLSFPIDMKFGPDGNLYITDAGGVRRYNGTTGASMGLFVAAGSGGLSHPWSLVFGPDGTLYVGSWGTHTVLHYNGATGAFLGVFASDPNLNEPTGMAFGPDGRFYVCEEGNNFVLRFNGSTGAFIDAFASGVSSDLAAPTGLQFGPDGNLYVTSVGTNSVLRYNGTTGAPIDAFVAAGSGGLAQPADLLFLPPRAPSSLMASPGYQQVNLSWTVNSDDESALVVWRKAGAGSYTRLAVLSPRTASYADTTAPPGSPFTYRVRAVSNVGASLWSNEATAAAWPLLPAAPTNLLVATASATQINLTWTAASPNLTGYLIWRKGGGSDWTQVALVGPTPTTFADIGLASDTPYTYRVRAINPYLTSDWSNEAVAWTAATPPAAPSSLAATVVSHTQINLSWTDNSNNETAFSIWRKGGVSDWTRIAVVGPNITSFSDTTASPSTAYSYRVRAVNSYFASSWSNEAAASTGP